MDDALARVLPRLARLSSIHTLAKLWATSGSLRRRFLASVDVKRAAAHVFAIRNDTCSARCDSFDSVVAAQVDGFYTLTPVMLHRPEVDISNYGLGEHNPRTHFYKAGLQHMFTRRKTTHETFLKIPQDGVTLCPIRYERLCHEGSNGFWAHGQIRVGFDIPAAVWHLDVRGLKTKPARIHRDAVKFPYIGFASDYGPWTQMYAIDMMYFFNVWEGMEAGFKIDVPGIYELKLRQHSESTLIAELSPGKGYSHARVRYLPSNDGPYHLVAHIPTCGDWLECEPPCILHLDSCCTGCSCICATSYAEANTFTSDSMSRGASTQCDVALIRGHALRHIA